MAAVELEFALDVSSGRLSSSYLTMQQWTMPSLVVGDVVYFRLRLVKQDPAKPPGWFSLVPLDGITVRIGIGTAGAPLTNVDLVVDGDALAGALPLNVAAVIALTVPATKIFEFRVTQGSGEPMRFQKNVTLIAAILPVTAVADPLPDEAITKAEAKALYVPRDGGVQGQGFRMIDRTTGQAFKVFMDNNELRWEPTA